DTTVNGFIMVKSTGILNTGSHVLSGSGPFILEPDATLKIGSAEGISQSGSTGNIQSEGERSFSPEANYVYNGSVKQQTGEALPAVLNGNLTIDNLSGVVANQSYKVNGTLFLTEGSFIFNDGLTLIANDKDIT